MLKVEGELVDGKKLIKEQKARVRKAKTKLEKDNKRRVVQTLEQAVKNIEEHRNLLEDQAANIASAKKNRPYVVVSKTSTQILWSILLLT